MIFRDGSINAIVFRGCIVGRDRDKSMFQWIPNRQRLDVLTFLKPVEMRWRLVKIWLPCVHWCNQVWETNLRLFEVYFNSRDFFCNPPSLLKKDTFPIAKRKHMLESHFEDLVTWYKRRQHPRHQGIMSTSSRAAAGIGMSRDQNLKSEEKEKTARNGAKDLIARATWSWLSAPCLQMVRIRPKLSSSVG